LVTANTSLPQLSTAQPTLLPWHYKIPNKNHIGCIWIKLKDEEETRLTTDYHIILIQ